MNNSLAVQNNYGRGCFKAVSEKYTFFQRLVMGPGFYSRETYITAQRNAVQASLPQGLERKMEPNYRRPQVIDTSIVNRIAPREKPRVYGQRQTGYLKPESRPVNRIQAYQDTEKPTNRLKQYNAPQPKRTQTNRVSQKLTNQNYEMLDSDLPNDFYLTPQEIVATMARNNENKYDSIDKILEPLDAKQCRRCSTPIMLGEMCNRCIALN